MHHWAFLQTIKCLPNLRHIETTRSTHWAAYSFEISQSLEEKWGLRVSLPGFLNPAPVRAMADVAAQCWEFVHPQITSLKLCDQTFKSENLDIDTWARKISHLTELDLECAVSGEAWSSESVPDWSAWAELLCKNLGYLTQLRKLRLACVQHMDLRRRLNSTWVMDEPYYLDDVFAGGKWPHLKSLSLVHWPLRQTALLRLIHHHAKHLRVLEFESITLSSEGYLDHEGPAENMADAIWLRVAKQCVKLCTLKHLDLKRVMSHYWHMKVNGAERMFAERDRSIWRSVGFQYLTEDGMDAVRQQMSSSSDTSFEIE